MARLVLTTPASLPFATEIEVRVTDLNYGNHLGHDALVTLLHEARWRFLRAHGLSELDCGGASLVVGDLAVVYRAECIAGDRLRIEVGVADVARVGCDFVYRVTRLGDGRLAAEAKTGIVFLDPRSRRPVQVPPAIAAIAATGHPETQP
ncbi:MAG: acyl-CoA thioesterase [Planctomycetes bacterium]|nr:acyl-CoA thioesterase [Planctomycetota bacterium]